MPSWSIATRPGALPTSMRSAAGGARSSNDGWASRSWTTTSARASSSAPRTVINPGSPGPAPTRYTVIARSRPRIDAQNRHHSLGTACRFGDGGSRGLHGREQGRAAELVEDHARDRPADRGGIRDHPGRAVPEHVRAVGGGEQTVERDRVTVDGRVRAARHRAATAELREEPPFGGDGGVRGSVVDRGEA